MTDAERFVETVFGTALSGYVLMWTLPGRRSRFFSVERLGELAAVAVQLGRDCDVYIGTTLRGRDCGPFARGEAADVIGVPALWVDLDVEKPSARRRYFRSSDAIHAFLDRLPIVPTVRVASGSGGIHAWWCLREVWSVDDAGERVRAAALVRGWQQYLMARAGALGFAMDSTFDLPRVLRLPGTRHHASGRPVELLTADGPRANVSDFAEWCVEVPAAPALARVDVPADATLPAEKLEALLANDAKFARTWRGERPDLRDQSRSALDLALASCAALAGWSDGEIVALLVAYRRQHGGIEKLARRDYLARTLGRARAQRDANGAPLEVRTGGLRVRRVAGGTWPR